MPASPLATVTERAGAVVSGRGVAAHYGSAAAELGVCVTAVGLADRSDLGKLELVGEDVGGLVERATGLRLRRGGVASTAGAWWCAISEDHVLVLCDRSRSSGILSLLEAEGRRFAHVEVADVSGSLAAIGLVGRHTPSVLLALGVRCARAARPFERTRIGGADGHVLFETDRRALIVTTRFAAPVAWNAIAAAGSAFGVSCVGTEAIERFALIDQTRMSR